MLSEYQSQISNNQKYILAGSLVFLALIIGVLSQSYSPTLSAGGDLGDDSAGIEQEFSSGAPAVAEPRAQSYVRDTSDSTESTDRKRITTIDVDFEVENALNAQTTAKQLTEDYGGWIESESFSRRNAKRANLDVRIPKENVSDFLNRAESSWTLDSKDENTRDVTDRYTEMSLELENKRQELQRLEELINETDDVENLVKIQERMSEIRSRIQYLENNIEDIDERVEYVEIDMTFQEDEPITAEFDPRDSVEDALQGIFHSMRLMIVGAGYLLPFALVFIVIHYGRKALKKRE